MRITRAIKSAVLAGLAELVNARPAKTTSALSQARLREAIERQYNPLRSLTPETLIGAIENYRLGYIKDAAKIWRGLEEQDDSIRPVSAKRKAKAARLQWEIITIQGAPEAESARHAEALTDFYNHLVAVDVLKRNRTGGVSLLVRQMMDAINMGWSVHELVWRPNGKSLSAEARFVPLHFFEHRTGTLRYLETDSAYDGVDMAPGEWLVTAADPLMIAGSICAFYRGQPLKDWIAFCDKFGIPGVIGSVDGQPGSDAWLAMETAVASIVTDWAAVKSHGDTIELLETKGGAAALPHPPLMAYLDKKIIVLWLGADLATQSAGNEAVGASLQGDETDTLVEDDAALISETLNEQVDRFVLQWHFGDGVTPLAYFRLQAPKKRNITTELAVDDWLLRSGAPVTVRSILERYGRPVPEAGDELLTPPAPAAPAGPWGFGNDADPQATALRAEVAAALQPIRDAIAARRGY